MLAACRRAARSSFVLGEALQCPLLAARRAAPASGSCYHGCPICCMSSGERRPDSVVDAAGQIMQRLASRPAQRLQGGLGRGRRQRRPGQLPPARAAGGGHRGPQQRQQVGQHAAVAALPHHRRRGKHGQQLTTVWRERAARALPAPCQRRSRGRRLQMGPVLPLH